MGNDARGLKSESDEAVFHNFNRRQGDPSCKTSLKRVGYRNTVLRNPRRPSFTNFSGDLTRRHCEFVNDLWHIHQLVYRPRLRKPCKMWSFLETLPTLLHQTLLNPVVGDEMVRKLSGRPASEQHSSEDKTNQNTWGVHQSEDLGTNCASTEDLGTHRGATFHVHLQRRPPRTTEVFFFFFHEAS